MVNHHILVLTATLSLDTPKKVHISSIKILAPKTIENKTANTAKSFKLSSNSSKDGSQLGIRSASMTHIHTGPRGYTVSVASRTGVIGLPET